MRIGIDIRTLMDSQYSGVSGYTYNLVRGLLEADKSREYRLFYNSGRDVSHKIPKFSQDNVEIVSTRYPNKIFNYLMQKSFSRPKIDRLLGVEHFIAPHINFFSFSEACRKMITIHDLSFLRYPEFFSLRKNIWHQALNVRKMLKRFDTVVAVSENTKRDIVDLAGIPEERVRVIYSGLGERYRPISRQAEPDRFAAVQKKYALPENFILCLSTLEPRKNIAGLIRAYGLFRDANSNFKDIKLVIAGSRGWKFADIFREWGESKYRADIKFIGYVDKDDKAYLYNLASLFVYPSFYEGFGFPPLEAAACGLPVIASSSSSLPEVMGKGALLVDPFNISEIALAMAMIINDHNLASGLIEEGKGLRDRFSWEKTSRAYLDLF